MTYFDDMFFHVIDSVALRQSVILNQMYSSAPTSKLFRFNGQMDNNAARDEFDTMMDKLQYKMFIDIIEQGLFNQMNHGPIADITNPRSVQHLYSLSSNIMDIIVYNFYSSKYSESLIKFKDVATRYKVISQQMSYHLTTIDKEADFYDCIDLFTSNSLDYSTELSNITLLYDSITPRDIKQVMSFPVYNLTPISYSRTGRSDFKKHLHLTPFSDSSLKYFNSNLITRMDKIVLNIELLNFNTITISGLFSRKFNVFQSGTSDVLNLDKDILSSSRRRAAKVDF